MDADGNLNTGNWGYYEPQPIKGHLGIQLKPEKPILSSRNHVPMLGVNAGFYHRDMGVAQPSISFNYGTDSWMNTRDRYMNNVLPGNSSFGIFPEVPRVHHNAMQMYQQPQSFKEERMIQVDEPSVEEESVPPLKKRQGKAEKSPKAKKAKKTSSGPNDGSGASVRRSKPAMKTTAVTINGIDMDISGIPIPICSCTGAPQQCYRWGSGGWQSACCTTAMSIYPLPMSTKRRGSRIAGRKMSLGAFKKVLEKLAAEGYNFSNPIDLRTHWAKHGTNKFVTIR